MIFLYVFIRFRLYCKIIFVVAVIDNVKFDVCSKYFFSTVL